MAFGNYRWGWLLRGVSAQERVMLLLLADQADSHGHISRLSHATIRARCGFSHTSRHSQKIIKQLMAKRFIVKREERQGAYGQQVSNAYEIDLGRYHPDSAAGLFYWSTAIEALREGQPERGLARIDHYIEGSTAYLDPADGVLTVWIQNRWARQYFFSRLGVILPAVRAVTFPTVEGRPEPPNRIELLSLDLTTD